jgi:hypothetical protein
MAKNKGQSSAPKKDNPQKIGEVKAQFQQLSAKDQWFFLREQGIFFLSWNMRPVAPPREMIPVLNSISLLSRQYNLLMDAAQQRRLPVTELSVVEESQMRENVVTPVNDALQTQINSIREVLDRNWGNSNSQSRQNSNKSASGSSSEDSEAEAQPEDETIDG